MKKKFAKYISLLVALILIMSSPAFQEVAKANPESHIYVEIRDQNGDRVGQYIQEAILCDLKQDNGPYIAMDNPNGLAVTVEPGVYFLSARVHPDYELTILSPEEIAKGSSMTIDVYDRDLSFNIEIRVDVDSYRPKNSKYYEYYLDGMLTADGKPRSFGRWYKDGVKLSLDEMEHFGPYKAGYSRSNVYIDLETGTRYDAGNSFTTQGRGIRFTMAPLSSIDFKMPDGSIRTVLPLSYFPIEDSQIPKLPDGYMWPQDEIDELKKSKPHPARQIKCQSLAEVKFYDGDRLLKKYRVSYNENISGYSRPSVSKKQGKKFVGWTRDGKIVDFNSPVRIKKNTNFYASYKDTVVVEEKEEVTLNCKINRDISRADKTKYTVSKGDEIKLDNRVTVINDNYKFVGWIDSNGNKYRSGDSLKINENMTLDALYKVKISFKHPDEDIEIWIDQGEKFDQELPELPRGLEWDLKGELEEEIEEPLTIGVKDSGDKIRVQYIYDEEMLIQDYQQAPGKLQVDKIPVFEAEEGCTIVYADAEAEQFYLYDALLDLEYDDDIVLYVFEFENDSGLVEALEVFDGVVDFDYQPEDPVEDSKLPEGIGVEDPEKENREDKKSYKIWLVLVLIFALVLLAGLGIYLKKKKDKKG